MYDMSGWRHGLDCFTIRLVNLLIISVAMTLTDSLDEASIELRSTRKSEQQPTRPCLAHDPPESVTGRHNVELISSLLRNELVSMFE